MLKRLLLMAGLVCLPSYSYSDSITPYYGTTPNAAINGHTWDMNTVLPTPPGLDINGVIYSYTPNKNTEDDMKVHVQNEKVGGGYIFRETDDWSGAQGGIEIRKVVPVIPQLPRELWGDGSIEVEGTGTVEDASVVYSYRVDHCYNPQFDPNCPGYEAPTPPEPEIVDPTTLYDATEDEAVKIATTETEIEYKDEDKKNTEDEDNDEEKEEMRLEAALSAIDNSALFAEAFAQSQILASMNLAISMNNYYAASIPGGVYKETVVLKDKKIEDNKKGLRNGLAQQLLHEKMIDMQYNN